MDIRDSDFELGRWVITAFAVVASCTSFEKSSVEPQARFGVSGTGGSGAASPIGSGGRGPIGVGGFGATGAGGVLPVGGRTGGLTGAGGTLCGNGRLDSGEQCDDQDFGNATCVTLLMTANVSGTLQCLSNCTVNVDNCGPVDAGFGGVAGTLGAGGVAGTLGAGGFGGGGVAGTLGFDAGSCRARGTTCTTGSTCCSNLACFGTCCGALGTYCTVSSNCCPFDNCQSNRCCHQNSVPCLVSSDCCSGACVNSYCAP